MASEQKVDEVKTGSRVNVQGNSRYKEISAKQEELMKQVSEMDLKKYQDDSSLVALKSFSGYYAVRLQLDAIGPLSIQTFISVDTNLAVTILDGADGIPIIFTSVDIIYPIIDKSGVVTRAASHTFNVGKDTFKDNKLEIKNDKVVLSLQFKRQNEDLAVPTGTNTIITSTMNGTMTLNGGAQYSVLGGTENNPIPYTTYKGEYYEEIFIPIITPFGPVGQIPISVPVLRIGDNWKIEYDFGSNDGKLSQVTAFCYNLNMYYFSFYTLGEDGTTIAWLERNALIMGTAAAKGLACNNMINLKSRSLVTIQFPRPGFVEFPPVIMPSRYSQVFNTHKEMKSKFEGVSIVTNPNSSSLAPYSGYYQLKLENNGSGNKNDSKGAFLSIQANEYYLDGIISNYTIDIGLSLNGTSSLSFKFDTSMSFDDKSKRLIIPGQLNVTFERKYDNNNGSLVQLTGTVGPFGNVNVSGFNCFNPVSLGSFSGKYYNASLQNDLVLNINETPNPSIYFFPPKFDVEYNGKKMKSFVYVPIMYILAQIPPKGCKDYVLMSLGTNGVHGVTGIITQFTNGSAGIPIIAQAYGPFPNSITGTTAATTETTASDNDKWIIHGKTYVIKFDNATAGALTLEQSTVTHPSYIPPGYSVTNPPKTINAGQTVEWGVSESGPYPVGAAGSATYSIGGGKSKAVVSWDFQYSGKPGSSCYTTSDVCDITYNQNSSTSVTFTLKSTIIDDKKN